MQATLARAMEPFFTTKGVGKGTGLGLSMVHGLTQQSGGKLALKSAVGIGTTPSCGFRLRLPMPTSGARSRCHIARKEPFAGHPGRRRRRLVLLNTAAMLEDLGHTVLEATSANKALEIIRRDDRIDLVITDQAMPAMTGSELAAAIRAEKPNLPVILATGFAELPPGADEGLPKLAKPFRQQQLAEAIAKIVALETVARAPAFR